MTFPLRDKSFFLTPPINSPFNYILKARLYCKESKAAAGFRRKIISTLIYIRTYANYHIGNLNWLKRQFLETVGKQVVSEKSQFTYPLHAQKYKINIMWVVYFELNRLSRLNNEEFAFSVATFTFCLALKIMSKAIYFARYYRINRTCCCRLFRRDARSRVSTTFTNKSNKNSRL